jgi:hypothetical protein
LDAAGSATAGILRGWEVSERGRDGDPPRVLGYALFKLAGSFSAGAESHSHTAPATGDLHDAVETFSLAPATESEHVESPCQVTLLDFASCAPLGSECSEAWLFRLAVIAAHAFFPSSADHITATVTLPCALAPRATSAGTAYPAAQGQWMYCDVVAAVAGMPAVLLPRIEEECHLVMPMDEF